jgi:hypothetical protein
VSSISVKPRSRFFRIFMASSFPTGWVAAPSACETRGDGLINSFYCPFVASLVKAKNRREFCGGGAFLLEIVWADWKEGYRLRQFDDVFARLPGGDQSPIPARSGRPMTHSSCFEPESRKPQPPGPNLHSEKRVPHNCRWGKHRVEKNSRPGTGRRAART